MTDSKTTRQTDDNDHLSSEDLAAIIIDALLRAQIVRSDDVQKAIAIATEEINVRKALGDY